jgi:NAD(P)-dependent dehydrogenase (short-subunit alcohol dehydrogenase family)
MTSDAWTNDPFTTAIAASGLAGKVAIVTGASRGIGRAIALTLARAGCRLVLTARTEFALGETAAAIAYHGGEVALVATPEPDAEKVVAAAVDRFGGIDVLINNAGTTKTGDFLSLTDEDWEDGYSVKFFGTMRLCRAAWPYLREARGAVVNIGGAGGRTPDERFTLGGSVNAAVMAFTKALAQLGIEDGVQVNLINPGLIRTDRLDRRIEESAARWSVGIEEATARMLKEQRTARFGESQEIADIVAYLASPMGRVFQGALIDADCGFTKGT